MADPGATIPATIVLPPELLPTDGRFGSGPSKVRPEAVAPSPASPRVPRHEPPPRPVRRRAPGPRPPRRAVLACRTGYEVLLGNGGTTPFWDAATFGLVEQRSQHLSFGEFSSKFARCRGPRRTSTTRS